MRSWTHRIACVLVAAILFAPAAFASKKYQVTGTVVEVSDKVIIVQKDTEKFEIDRNSDTKVTGDIKVGGKVTVYYYMAAISAEAKK